MACGIYRLRDWSRVEPGEVLGCRPARRWILYLGEVHEAGWSIYCNTMLLREAAKAGARFLGLEHFTYDQQELLDEWFAGTLDWGGLTGKYTGGFRLDAYEPLLEEARRLGLRPVALFPPRRLASQVARMGIDALDSLETPLPPSLLREAVVEEYRGYRERLLSLFPREGPMARLGKEGLILAQAFKDTVAGYLAAEASSRYGSGIVLAGWAHVEFNGSIPSRARRFDPGHGFLAVTARESGLDEARSRLEEWLPVTIASFLSIPHGH